MPSRQPETSSVASAHAWQRLAQTALVALLCALTLASLGCKKRRVHAAPPAASPAPPTRAQPETPPEAAPATTPPALVVPPPKTAPPKPAPPKPAPPQISPRLSPAEQAAAERQTKEDISGAERNLQVAYGKQLNAAQHDLLEKIRSFLGQAREAIRASDWVRARNLAQKALVLSVELVNSL